MTKVWNEEKLKELLGEYYKDIIRIRIKNKIFIFDQESDQLYDEFRKTRRIDLDGDYLIGRDKTEPEKVDYFHIWLVKEELGKEREKTEEPLEVHHTTFLSRINIKHFLKVVTSVSHDLIHSGEKRRMGYHGIRLIEDPSRFNDYLDSLDSEILFNQDAQDKEEGNEKILKLYGKGESSIDQTNRDF